MYALGTTGINAVDEETRQAFTLRTCQWVIMANDDGPTFADAMGMKRPGNFFGPCRNCVNII